LAFSDFSPLEFFSLIIRRKAAGKRRLGFFRPTLASVRPKMPLFRFVAGLPAGDIAVSISSAARLASAALEKLFGQRASGGVSPPLARFPAAVSAPAAS
jgi:hypothetical protein